MQDKKRPDGVEVVASGPLDAKGAAKLRHILLQQVRSGRTHIILDVKSVPYINSDGLKMLVAVRSDKPDVDVRIKNANSHVIRTFELANLDEVFDVTGSKESYEVEAA